MHGMEPAMSESFQTINLLIFDQDSSRCSARINALSREPDIRTLRPVSWTDDLLMPGAVRDIDALRPALANHEWQSPSQQRRRL